MAKHLEKVCVCVFRLSRDVFQVDRPQYFIKGDVCVFAPYILMRHML